MSERPDVSVVVPARNAAATLPGVLEALGAQSAPPGAYEVVVVDDGSSDATAQLARSAGVAVIQAPHIGVAAARNLGAKESQGANLAFLDADCVPAPTWVESGLEALQGADVLAGQIDVGVGRGSPVALVDLTHYFDQERYASDGYGATGNLWVRREVFERVGGFDEGLARDEDRDFGLRATAAGAELAYAGDVAVTHPARGALELMRRSFRIGTDRGLGGLRARSRTGAYVSDERMRARMTRAGYPPTRGRMLAVRLAKNACIRLPMALGALTAPLTGRRRAS